MMSKPPLRRTTRLTYYNAAGLNLDSCLFYVDAQFVYYNADLTRQIVPYLDLPSLVALSQVDRAGREMAQEEFKARLRALLEPFLPKGCFDAFFDMMKRTGIIMVGGIPLYASTINMPHILPRRKPRLREWWAVTTDTYDMNLLVPVGSWDQVVQWFLDMNCEPFVNQVVASSFEHTVISFVSTSFLRGGKIRVSELHPSPRT